MTGHVGGFSEFDPMGRARLEVRATRTGRLVLAIPGEYGGSDIVWEDARTALLPALHYDAENDITTYVAVRTDMLTGVQERIGQDRAGDTFSGWMHVFPLPR